jgi:hypothetical protein
MASRVQIGEAFQMGFFVSLFNSLQPAEKKPVRTSPQSLSALAESAEMPASGGRG